MAGGGLPDLLFDGGGAIAVEHHHREAPIASLAQRLEVPVQDRGVGRRKDAAIARDARVDLDHRPVERGHPRDLEREEVRPALVADEQRIAEAARDQERGRLAPPLEQRVRRQRGAHAHVAGRDGGVRGQAEEVADPQERRLVAAQHLGDADLAGLAIAQQAVGEGAPAIDPDLMGACYRG